MLSTARSGRIWMVAMAPSSHRRIWTRLPTCKRFRPSCASVATSRRMFKRSCTGTGSDFFGKLGRPLSDRDAGDDAKAAEDEWQGDRLAEQHGRENNCPERDGILEHGDGGRAQASERGRPEEIGDAGADNANVEDQEPLGEWQVAETREGTAEDRDQEPGNRAEEAGGDDDCLRIALPHCPLPQDDVGRPGRATHKRQANAERVEDERTETGWAFSENDENKSDQAHQHPGDHAEMDPPSVEQDQAKRYEKRADVGQQASDRRWQERESGRRAARAEEKTEQSEYGHGAKTAP